MREKKMFLLVICMCLVSLVANAEGAFKREGNKIYGVFTSMKNYISRKSIEGKIAVAIDFDEKRIKVVEIFNNKVERSSYRIETIPSGKEKVMCIPVVGLMGIGYVYCLNVEDETLNIYSGGTIVFELEYPKKEENVYMETLKEAEEVEKKAEELKKEEKRKENMRDEWRRTFKLVYNDNSEGIVTKVGDRSKKNPLRKDKKVFVYKWEDSKGGVNK